MTSLPPDPDLPDIDDDEAAVHAVLDGEATPEQRRAVARDGVLRARLEELRSVAAAIAESPDEPSAAIYDTIRGRAVAAFDTPGDGRTDEGVLDDSAHAGPASSVTQPDDDADDRVVPLSPRRHRRLPPLPAVAAAVVVLLAIGVGLILTDRDQGDQRADLTSAGAASADKAEAEAAGDAEGEERGGREDQRGEDGAVSSTEGSGPALDAAASRAPFADEEALRTALETVEPTTLAALYPSSAHASSTSETSGATDFDSEDYASDPEVQRCSAVLEAMDPDIEPVQSAVPVLVDGERVLVLSNPVRASEDTKASIRLSVVGPGDCYPRFAVER